MTRQRPYDRKHFFPSVMPWGLVLTIMACAGQARAQTLNSSQSANSGSAANLSSLLKGASNGASLGQVGLAVSDTVDESVSSSYSGEMSTDASSLSNTGVSGSGGRLKAQVSLLEEQPSNGSKASRLSSAIQSAASGGLPGVGALRRGGMATPSVATMLGAAHASGLPQQQVSAGEGAAEESGVASEAAAEEPGVTTEAATEESDVATGAAEEDSADASEGTAEESDVATGATVESDNGLEKIGDPFKLSLAPPLAPAFASLCTQDCGVGAGSETTGAEATGVEATGKNPPGVLTPTLSQFTDRLHTSGNIVGNAPNPLLDPLAGVESTLIDRASGQSPTSAQGEPHQ